MQSCSPCSARACASAASRAQQAPAREAQLTVPGRSSARARRCVALAHRCTRQHVGLDRRQDPVRQGSARRRPHASPRHDRGAARRVAAGSTRDGARGAESRRATPAANCALRRSARPPRVPGRRPARRAGRSWLRGATARRGRPAPSAPRLRARAAPVRQRRPARPLRPHARRPPARRTGRGRTGLRHRGRPGTEPKAPRRPRAADRGARCRREGGREPRWRLPRAPAASVNSSSAQARSARAPRSSKSSSCRCTSSFARRDSDALRRSASRAGSRSRSPPGSVRSLRLAERPARRRSPAARAAAGACAPRPRGRGALDLRRDPRELQLGAMTPQLEAAEAGRLLDERAPLGRLRAEHRLDAALRDHRAQAAAEADVGEQLDEVDAPHRRPVDEVLALAAAMQPPRERDLREHGRSASRRPRCRTPARPRRTRRACERTSRRTARRRASRPAARAG